MLWLRSASVALGVALTTLMAAKPLALAQETAPDPVARVLIVTGNDPSHDWRSTTPVLQLLLRQDHRLNVDVLTELGGLADVDLQQYSSIVINFKNTDPDVPGRQAFENVRTFVRDGGGLVLVHFGCGAFEEFKEEYRAIVGRVWMGLDPPPGRRQHDPRGPFTVEIDDVQHVITAGIDRFATNDELYTCLEGDAKVTVLATAQSKLDGQSYPMVILHPYGKGRVFLCTLGHDVEALSVEEVAELYRRGCAWTAGLKPVPDKS